MTERKLHLYTLHATYTGPWCAQCGHSPSQLWHDQTKWIVDGQIIERGGQANAPNEGTAHAG